MLYLNNFQEVEGERRFLSPLSPLSPIPPLSDPLRPHAGEMGQLGRHLRVFVACYDKVGLTTVRYSMLPTWEMNLPPEEMSLPPGK